MRGRKEYLERFKQRYPYGVGNTCIAVQLRMELMYALEWNSQLSDKVQELENKLSIRGVKRVINRRLKR